MKNKRRMTSIYNKLIKAEQTEEVALAVKLLGWVLEQNDLEFGEIVEGIEEPSPRLSVDLFAYDAVQEVWAMKNPYNHDQVYITDRVPDYTPASWWDKVDINKIAEEVVIGTDYLKVRDKLPGERVLWTKIPEVFQEYKDFFRRQLDAERYLEHFYSVDYSGRMEISAAERRAFQERTDCSARNLRAEIEKKYKAKWVYTYKNKGDRTWVMRTNTIE